MSVTVSCELLSLVVCLWFVARLSTDAPVRCKRSLSSTISSATRESLVNSWPLCSLLCRSADIFLLFSATFQAFVVLHLGICHLLWFFACGLLVQIVGRSVVRRNGCTFSKSEGRKTRFEIECWLFLDSYSSVFFCGNVMLFRGFFQDNFIFSSQFFVGFCR